MQADLGLSHCLRVEALQLVYLRDVSWNHMFVCFSPSVSVAIIPVDFNEKETIF